MDLKKELIQLRINMLKIDSLIMVSNRPIDANAVAMNSLNTITKLIEAEERKEEQLETTSNCDIPVVSDCDIFECKSCHNKSAVIEGGVNINIRNKEKVNLKQYWCMKCGHDWFE